MSWKGLHSGSVAAAAGFLVALLAVVWGLLRSQEGQHSGLTPLGPPPQNMYPWRSWCLASRWTLSLLRDLPLLLRSRRLRIADYPICQAQGLAQMHFDAGTRPGLPRITRQQRKKY